MEMGKYITLFNAGIWYLVICWAQTFLVCTVGIRAPQ